MFEKVKQEEENKKINEKLDQIDKKLVELLKVVKENKNASKNAQN